MGIEMEESTAQVVLAFLLALALMLVASTGGDEAYWRNRDTWMREAKESGAWVMW